MEAHLTREERSTLLCEAILDAGEVNRTLMAQAQDRVALCHLKRSRPQKVAGAFRKLINQFPELAELTAKGQESDIILGLNLGADDYVTKPFSIDILLARANACLRRRRDQQRQAVEFGDCRLDCDSHELFRKGRDVPLTPKEYRLLEFFVQNTGRALTRDQILDGVWGRDITVTDRSVDRCINTLRNKIEPDPQRPNFIQTIRDVGYRFEAPAVS